ncbi:MAG: nitroreductase family protein [Deltaproteobacteria bacterium]|nr:nitroreductase family protein [Deltaproteobacteria bacterium]
MEFKELEDLIKTRKSIRRWQQKPVPENMLLKAVELATWAPSGGNLQNWHFYIIIARDTINAIADAVQSTVDLMASWPEAGEFGDTFKNYSQFSTFFRSAPAAIAVASSRYQSIADRLLEMRESVDFQAKEMREWRKTADSRIQSTSAAVAYLLLILHQMGLGATWMTGPIQAAGAIQKILRVPPGWEIVTFIPVGYPDEQPRPGRRKSVSEVAEVIK